MLSKYSMKKKLYPPLWHSHWPGGIHLHSPPLSNNVPYLPVISPLSAYYPPSWSFSQPLSLRDLPIFSNPSRYLTASILLWVPLKNIIRTALLVSSLIPFPVLTYVELPASTGLFYPQPSRMSVTIFTTTSHAIVPMVDPKLKALTFNIPPLHSYHHPRSGWLLPFLPHNTSPLVLPMSPMP